MKKCLYLLLIILINAFYINVLPDKVGISFPNTGNMTEDKIKLCDENNCQLEIDEDDIKVHAIKFTGNIEKMVNEGVYKNKPGIVEVEGYISQYDSKSKYIFQYSVEVPHRKRLYTYQDSDLDRAQVKSSLAYKYFLDFLKYYCKFHSQTRLARIDLPIDNNFFTPDKPICTPSLSKEIKLPDNTKKIINYCQADINSVVIDQAHVIINDVEFPDGPKDYKKGKLEIKYNLFEESRFINQLKYTVNDKVIYFSNDQNKIKNLLENIIFFKLCPK